jgi:hypothetical protein
MTVKDLRAKCKELGITGYSRMNKGALEKAIAQAEANANVSTPVEAEAEVSVEPTSDELYLGMNKTEFGQFLGTLSKGEARRARKAARSAGFGGFAGVRRIVGTSSQKVAA